MSKAKKKSVEEIIEESINIVAMGKVIEERTKIKTVTKNGRKIQVQLFVTRDDFDFM